jgi:hypothetical protein
MTEMSKLTADSAAVRLYMSLFEDTDRDWTMRLIQRNPSEQDKAVRLAAEHERLCLVRIATAEREARVKALKEAMEAVRDCYFTSENDIEEAKCAGVKSCEDAIAALIAVETTLGGR